MFTFSVRVRRRRIIICLTAVCALLGGIASLNMSDEPQAVSTQVSAEINVKKSKIETNDDRVKFLHSLGWEVDSEPLEVTDILIPKEPNEVYTNYNELQKQQGFDLNKYKGKTLKRYTYKICNYPELPDSVQAHLIIYKNKVVGGDICGIEGDGFMHGLKC